MCFESLYWIHYNSPSVLHFDFFDCEVLGILVRWPGIEPMAAASEGEVLTTGQPGKSLRHVLNDCFELLNLDSE